MHASILISPTCSYLLELRSRCVLNPVCASLSQRGNINCIVISEGSQLTTHDVPNSNEPSRIISIHFLQWRCDMNTSHQAETCGDYRAVHVFSLQVPNLSHRGVTPVICHPFLLALLWEENSAASSFRSPHQILSKFPHYCGSTGIYAC
jgi:hypothetical protein